MYLFIKNMVCVRCKMAVQSVLDLHGVQYVTIHLGKVLLQNTLTAAEISVLRKSLQEYELDIMDNPRQIMVEQIKVVILDLLQTEREHPLKKLSAILSEALHHDYTYLANVFSAQEGSTIEKFYIINRIERVKELLIYEEMNIKEIAYLLSYSSAAHLYGQFKRVTGLTPTIFKQLCATDDYQWRTLDTNKISFKKEAHEK